MKLARYVGNGRLEIREEPKPECPPGGLLVQIEASGLCSGELMDWYMDKKIPHVIGHEIAGIVVESQDDRFKVGDRVFPHHHAPDLNSDLSKRGAHVHDETWRKTKLTPGGMAEYCAVPKENLADTLVCNDLRAIDAALIEPLGCVMKAIRKLNLRGDETVSVVGLGFMGIAFSLILKGSHDLVAYDLNPERIDWAVKQGITARQNADDRKSEIVIVCPGSNAALDFALSIAAPEPKILLFAPMGPGELTTLDLHKLYFQDLTLICSYSCGPQDTLAAKKVLEAKTVQAEQVVSEFIELNDLPDAYQKMKAGEIIKPMVVFPS